LDEGWLLVDEHGLKLLAKVAVQILEELLGLLPHLWVRVFEGAVDLVQEPF